MQDTTREALRDAWDRWGCFGTLVLALLVLGLGLWSVTGEGSAKVGAKVSAVAFRDAEGGRHTLAEFAGKVVVVDVWATWCPPCRASLPEIAALQAASNGKYAVLPISVDEGGFPTVAGYLAGQPGPVRTLKAYVPEGAQALDAFGPIRGIPTTLIVGADGTLRTRWSGYYPGRTEAELTAALK